MPSNAQLLAEPLFWLACLFLLALVLFFVLQLVKHFSKIELVRSQQKSSEVRLGKISETLSPLLSSFPVDIQKPGTSTVFLGQPVDFVHFDPEEGVTFIEVKSGEARLSANQKKIKELIEAGQVSWAEIRVK